VDILEKDYTDNNAAGRFSDYRSKWCEDVEKMGESRIPKSILNSEL
jgi:hypothetical protein